MAVDNNYKEKDDLSYPAPEMQLQWRLEDLQMRIEELCKTGAHYTDGSHFSDKDICYVLPEELYSIWDVERAIELAEHDLQVKYGTSLCKEFERAADLDNSASEEQEKVLLVGFSVPLYTRTEIIAA